MANIRLKKKYLAGTKQVIEKSATERRPYKVSILGKEFVVYPNVFSPKYFFDTEFFAKNVKVKKGDEFLEIGPGTGAISIFVALSCARRVVAVDINPNAAKNTKANAKLHNVEKKIEVYQGDVYSPLKNKDKFDVIFWNTPFGYVESEKISFLERAVFDPKYISTKKFIRGARQHLKTNGYLLIGFSTTLGHFSILKKLLHDEEFIVKLLKEIESIETHPVKFQLYKAVLKKNSK